jgi:thiol-disulfide isomerase/thioredoxin
MKKLLLPLMFVAGACTPPPAENAGASNCSVEVGKAACEIEAEPLLGDGPKTLADGKGQVVVLDFWATHCAPCKKSFPQYQALVDKYAGKLSVIAVSLDDPEDVDDAAVKKYADDLGVSFSVVWDKGGATAATYRPPKMPTSYVIDREGIVRHVHAGFESDEAETIGTEVEELLK